SASETQVIDIQYFLARTLESVGQIAEAAPLFRRIAQTDPRFKDAAYRANQLSSKLKHPTNGERGGAGNPSWVSNAIKSSPHRPLLASRYPPPPSPLTFHAFLPRPARRVRLALSYQLSPHTPGLPPVPYALCSRHQLSAISSSGP